MEKGQEEKQCVKSLEKKANRRIVLGNKGNRPSPLWHGVERLLGTA